MGSSYQGSQNLQSLIWQLPYADRKSILQKQQSVIEANADVDEDEFEMASETDLNDEELDLNVSRKMSIRALNVVTMHRFSPGSITNGD